MTSKTLISLALYCLSLPFAHSQTPRIFTRIDVRGATHTEANGIDRLGDVVGFFVDSKLVEHGFKISQGKTTVINFPGSTGTRAYGIDLNGEFVVGTFTDATGIPHGFQLNSTGKLTQIDVPGAAWTRALSVNSVGTIVGAFADQSGVVHGFLDQNGAGTFTTVDFEGAVTTELHGIVNLRYMAGIFVNASGVEHGAQGAAGSLQTKISVPGAALTSADGVTDSIDIVGHFGATVAGPLPRLSLCRRPLQDDRFSQRHRHPL